MKTEKPLPLIKLLQELLAETEKINIGKIYIAIVEETKKIVFADPHNELVYKHLIQLAIKDYIHSGHSQASIAVLNDVISLLKNAETTP